MGFMKLEVCSMHRDMAYWDSRNVAVSQYRDSVALPPAVQPPPASLQGNEKLRSAIRSIPMPYAGLHRRSSLLIFGWVPDSCVAFHACRATRSRPDHSRIHTADQPRSHSAMQGIIILVTPSQVCSAQEDMAPCGIGTPIHVLWFGSDVLASCIV